LASPVNQKNGVIAQLVSAHGLAAFTPEDFFTVSKQVSVEPSRLILVGGQALEVWSVLLDVPAPGGSGTPLTEDTDWLGGANDAQWLADQLVATMSIELKLATLDDSTPNTAVMLLHRNGTERVLLMDFLHSVTGLTDRAIHALAVTIDLPHQETGDTVTLRVLHPLHCMASRLANLKTHESKRNGNGVQQAQWAIDILAAWLRVVVQDGQEKQVRKACQSVAKLAQKDYARYCYHAYQLDPLQAISSAMVAAGGNGFNTQDWPTTIERIGRQRLRQASWQAEAQARRESAAKRRTNPG
jgi:hypothetical protein